MKRAFEIIWEDDHFLVLNKRAGVLSIPDRYHDDKVNLFSLLVHYRDMIYPLHRLDKETSGIMIYAKDEEAHKRMSEMFEDRKIYKEYAALITRTPLEQKGTIETNLAASLQKKDQIVVSKKGKHAVTEYEVVESFKDYSLCKIVIHSGRQHQIRVHMAHIGHPLAVDKKYGYKTEIFAQEIKPKKFNPNRRGESKPLMNRHSLHAKKIGFVHPFTNEDLTFEAPFPKDFRAVLNQLRKWNN
jgi:23S rRNA pseudouridine955/2504/2580 synthase/23S rRNA pseudouridine1911/1915/1917 synthase